MSRFLKRGKKIRNIEEIKLNPNAMGELGKEAAIVVLPLIAILASLMILPRYYHITSDIFTVMLGTGMVAWFAFIVLFYGYVKSDAAGLILFDREFGFDERHHPRYEIKCQPQDIRLLYSPEDEMHNKELFNERIDKLGLKPDLAQKIKELFKDADFNKKYMYYMKHHKSTQQCLGLDLYRNEIHEFKSHIVFQDKPYDQQYVFSEGQENWHMGMLYNHTHAEQDGVKVLGWGLDFTTNEPMPLCLLTYNAIQYKRNIEKKNDPPKDFEFVDAMATVMAVQHNGLNTLTKEKQQYEGLFEGKLIEVDSTLKTGQQIAERIVELYEKTKKPVSRRLWSQGWFKALVTIAMMACIVIIVIYVLQWLGYVKLG